MFCREGDFWTIAYQGVVFRLRDLKGLHCVAHLLHHPGERFASRVLLDLPEAANPPAEHPDEEHARVVVTKRIKAAIKKVAAQHAILGYFLATRIKTGYACAYIPGPQDRVSWYV